MIRDLNVQAVVSRRWTRTGSTFLIHDDQQEPRFMAALRVPRGNDSGNDASPRTQPSYTLSWRGGLLGPREGAIRAGYRLSLRRAIGSSPFGSMPYEVLADPRPLVGGPDTNGFSCPILPVETLYPYEVRVSDQGGTTLKIDQPVALWSTGETHGDRGTYEDWSGEAGIDAQTLVKENNSLWLGADRFRVLTARIDYEGPRVLFTARRSGA